LEVGFVAYSVSRLRPYARPGGVATGKIGGWQMAEGFGRTRHSVRAGSCGRVPSHKRRAEDCPPYRSGDAATRLKNDTPNKIKYVAPERSLGKLDCATTKISRLRR